MSDGVLKEVLARGPEIRRLLLKAYDSGQQTRVETVIPYYMEWMKRFPDLDSLAAAEEDLVLRTWQGLGYYSRARNLHRAAKLVREKRGGSLPNSAAEWTSLPGVGEYTAGAVASIAFGEAVPAVDGNVRRVLCRLFDLPDPGAAELRGLAEHLVDRNRPGDFNQALMELGALTCTPRGPACNTCPLRDFCMALDRNTVGERPVKTKRLPLPEIHVAVVVGVSSGGMSWSDPPARDAIRFLLRRRPEKGLLARMWEFPGAEVEGGAGRVREERVVQLALNLADELGLGRNAAGPSAPGRAIGGLENPHPIPMEGVTHLFTHLRVRYRPFLFPVVDGPVGSGESGWFFEAETDQLPLPVAQRKILMGALGKLCGV